MKTKIIFLVLSCSIYFFILGLFIGKVIYYPKPLTYMERISEIHNYMQKDVILYAWRQTYCKNRKEFIVLPTPMD